MDMTEITKFDRANVGTIKLSEAMRIGASKTPQSRMACYYNEDGSACAWGAVAIGYGAEGMGPINKMAGELHRAHPHLFGVMERNDFAGWTREAIADWLEGQGY